LQVLLFDRFFGGLFSQQIKVRAVDLYRALGRAQPFLAAGVLVLESGGIECDYRKPAGTGRSGVG